MAKRFLTARWSHLALLNFAVPREVLEPYLPAGCELDQGVFDEGNGRKGEGYCSLVAFDFLECRVLGVGWPGLRNFPEVNLRFYVRCGTDRGVVFVKELVPQRFVAAMARWTYNEPYESTPMRSRVETMESEIRVEHEVAYKGQVQRLKVCGEAEAREMPQDSEAHFFKEHRWGFGRSRRGEVIRYEVVHPTWRCFPVKQWELEWDFGLLYGERFAWLNGRSPRSVVLAEGSGVEVFIWGRVGNGLTPHGTGRKEGRSQVILDLE